MANQSPFDKTNPFSFGTSSTSSTSSRPRGGSLAKRPPSAPPSLPPKAPPSTPSMGGDQHLRQQLHQYQNMYKQTKNQLEVLKAQYRGQEKELSTFKSQKHLIDTNHSNILSWQKKISELESEKERLIDKNGLFLQQKNEYLLQLADQQQMNEECKVQIDSKTAEIDKLETELTNSSQNFTQQLSKKDNKYKSLKVEYQSLSKEYMSRKNENKLMKEELNSMAISIKEMKQESLLLTDKYEKLLNEHDTLKLDHQQVNEDSTIAVQLASKKDKNIIKDLRQTLKTETMKLQQMKAENMQLKDELNDLRDWRENYLKQQKLAQISNDHGSRESSQENKVHEDISDNVSSTSSASNHTASSKNSKSTSSRNHITVKQKAIIMKKKSMRAMKTAKSNMSVPSLSNLISNEFAADDEKIAPSSPNISNHLNTNMNISSMHSSTDVTKEHDEVIQALSDRLAIVKENYMNLKHVVSSKDDKIEKLNFELSKKMEMISDLIEKLNDKPLPPTPQQLAKLEQAENEYIRKETQSDEDKVLINLEEQGLSGPIARKMYQRHSGDSQQLLREANKPPIPSGAPPPLNGSKSLDMSRIQRPPPPGPPPKVVVSPSYNKGIGRNSHFPFQQNQSNNNNNNNNGNNNEQIMQNQIKKAKEQKYISNSKELNQNSLNEMQPLVNNDNNNIAEDMMNGNAI